VRQGFSLIEVIISVMIITVLGFSLLQMNSNTIRSVELFENRLKVDEFSSPVFHNINEELHDKSDTIYDFIKMRYSSINDDDLIEYLKSREYLYRQNELYFLHFGEDGDLSMEAVENSESGKEVTSEVKREGVLIEEVVLRDEGNSSTSIYHFSFSEESAK